MTIHRTLVLLLALFHRPVFMSVPGYFCCYISAVYIFEIRYFWCLHCWEQHSKPLGISFIMNYESSIYYLTIFTLLNFCVCVGSKRFASVLGTTSLWFKLVLTSEICGQSLICQTEYTVENCDVKLWAWIQITDPLGGITWLLDLYFVEWVCSSLVFVLRKHLAPWPQTPIKGSVSFCDLF